MVVQAVKEIDEHRHIDHFLIQYAVLLGTRMEVRRGILAVVVVSVEPVLDEGFHNFDEVVAFSFIEQFPRGFYRVE